MSPPPLPNAAPAKPKVQRKPRAYSTVSARIPMEQKRILDDLSLATGIGVDDLVRFAVLNMLMSGTTALVAVKTAKRGASDVLATLAKLPEVEPDHANEGVDG